MCDDHIGLCPHTPGGDPHEPADAPAAQSQSDALAKQPNGEMSQQELGLHFDLKPGSLSEILSKIECAGLIERSRNPKDRRQLTIRLTEAGWEKAHVEQAARIRFREQAFSALTHDEREDLAEMLDKIRVTWEELDD